MQIHSEQEALYLACEMEALAVQLYQRALMIMEKQNRQNEPLYERMMQMLEDERSHLTQFRAFYTGVDASREQEVSLSAVAEGILFEGGLMGAVRQGLLTDVEHLLFIATKAEQMSVEKYRAFASITTDPKARDTLLCIATQEEAHLSDLQAWQETHRN